MSFIKVCSDWELLDMAEGLQFPTTLEQELAKRFRLRLEEEERDAKYASYFDQLTKRAEQLVRDAKLRGFVVRIETVPLKPLAMGHHAMKVSVDRAHPY